ncbi:hypothetical protein [Sphingopyxis sp. L1A2A]|uniref:hypothetical protein n=1 Tax=Sphingopyxis sp. L1A2A TaxID=2502247 RepID=UPI0010FA12EE|nr:hypothetical protein [Sphingopyxis sp. L1A2A]
MITLTKKMVARAQLDESIELVLRHSNPVASNTLAWAAVDVLEALAKKRGIEGFYKQMEVGIKPQFLNSWYNTLKNGYNFAKHADRDPDRSIDDFRPEAVTWTIFGGCLTYSRVFGTRSWNMLVFQMWFNCRNPHILTEESRELAERLAPGFEYPDQRAFADSTASALEILQTGQKHPGLMKAKLGENWLGNIEFRPVF